jgi:hypothetical protein
MAEARQAVSLITQLSGPTTKEDLLRAYAPLLLIYDPKDFGKGRNEKERQEIAALEKGWLDVHYKVLGPLPLESIKVAVQYCLETKTFSQFPLPSDLFTIASKDSAEIKMIAYRLKRAVEEGETRAVPEKTEEDRAKVKELLQSMRGPDGKITLGRPLPKVTPLHDQHSLADALRRMDDQG